MYNHVKATQALLLSLDCHIPTAHLRTRQKLLTFLSTSMMKAFKNAELLCFCRPASCEFSKSLCSLQISATELKGSTKSKSLHYAALYMI
ncbi:hypothetical protein SLEP1_g29891 [Rubroshorea leprosula]|uniref:Uncharacterized protein n=1 Tax=Rubroshorea leprosula TaxID=152421 RepID=A0AAV5K746_9ROSI|nr:hypothetical protein SLEP1_g29891 [Rubroshorea leprosula]